MERTLIPGSVPDEKTVRAGLLEGVKACLRLGAPVLTLIAPAKKGFGDTVTGRALEAAAVKRLLAGRTVRLTDGVTLAFESLGTLRTGMTVEAVLAIHIREESFRLIDDLAGTNVIIYVPWLQEEGEVWRKKWNARVAGRVFEPAVPELDNEVLRELQALTESVNLSTGLIDPRDKQRAKEMFIRLKGKHSLNAQEIEKWALQNGWKVRHVAALYKLAARYAR